jgi:hypothetical protein
VIYVRVEAVLRLIPGRAPATVMRMRARQLPVAAVRSNSPLIVLPTLEARQQRRTNREPRQVYRGGGDTRPILAASRTRRAGPPNAET